MEIEYGQKFMLRTFHGEAAIAFLDFNLDRGLKWNASEALERIQRSFKFKTLFSQLEIVLLSRTAKQTTFTSFPRSFPHLFVREQAWHYQNIQGKTHKGLV